MQIPMDSAAIDEAERLEPELRRLRIEDGVQEDLSVQVRETAEHIDALQQQARASEVTFTFRGVGRGLYSKLLSEHPPTAEQRAAAGDAADALIYNVDTFPPALLAASIVEPEDLHGDLDECATIHDEWSNGQVTRLWRACIQANNGVAETPKIPLVSVILGQPDSGTS